MARKKDDKLDTGRDSFIENVETSYLTFPEGYEKVYKTFSGLLDEDKYLTKIIITSRGTGKSHNIKVKILE